MLQVYERTRNHPNILHMYEGRHLIIDKKQVTMVLFEPLGKSLHFLMYEASACGGFSINLIKKVAKDILAALKRLHDDCGFLHTDVKLSNIATTTFQKKLYQQLKEIVDEQKCLKPLRMTCQQGDNQFNEEGARERFEMWVEKLSPLENKEETEEVSFKLLDLGNAMKAGEHRSTGSSGYRPPEYFFGAPIRYPFDIWALGVTLIRLFTKERFIQPATNHRNELQEIMKIFSKLPSNPDSENPQNFKKQYITNLLSADVDEEVKGALQKKIKCPHHSETIQAEFLDFLIHMLHIDPKKRWSAAELLHHGWLKDVN